MITPEYLREVLDYNPETGVLSWRYRDESHFHGERWHKAWNSRFAGKPTGSLDKSGYLRVNLNGILRPAHRLIWAMIFDNFPKFIDHIDTNRSNNKLNNLRECTNIQNSRNRGKNKNNTSGFKGVSFHKSTGKWSANIKDDGRQIWLGIYESPEEASAAYCSAADKLHGEFSNNGFDLLD